MAKGGGGAAGRTAGGSTGGSGGGISSTLGAGTITRGKNPTLTDKGIQALSTTKDQISVSLETVAKYPGGFTRSMVIITNTTAGKRTITNTPMGPINAPARTPKQGTAMSITNTGFGTVKQGDLVAGLKDLRSKGYVVRKITRI